MLPFGAEAVPRSRLGDVQRLADEGGSPQAEDDGDEMDFATAALCAPERDGAPWQTLLSLDPSLLGPV